MLHIGILGIVWESIIASYRILFYNCMKLATRNNEIEAIKQNSLPNYVKKFKTNIQYIF